jgi:DNA-binding NarL/FixJ family response regulator/DNA-binding SARP family transcriptional activator
MVQTVAEDTRWSRRVNDDEYMPNSMEDAGGTTTKLSINILGPLRVRRGGVVIGSHELGGPKPRQVLEILLLKLGTPVSKNHLIDVLWNGQPPAEALSTLESYVSVLRRHLQPGSGKGGALRTVTGGYMIDRSMVDLDLDRFDDLLKQAGHASPEESFRLLEKALDIASVPLLGDELLAGWAEEERALHSARVASIKARAAEAAVAVGHPERAVALASELLVDDPINERAWTALVLGLEESGQYMEALRAYGRCRRVMDQEIGCLPGRPLREAHARLLQATAASEDEMDLSDSEAPIPATSQITREISILTIDDHSTFTELLTAALDREPDLRSVASATTAKSGVEQSIALKPDVVIMDFHLPDGDGLTAAARILADAPNTRIVMLTGDPTPEALRTAASMGICAFLPKGGSLSTLLDTLRYARAGNMVVHPSLVAQLGMSTPAPAPAVREVEPGGPVLTPRELDVLRLMAGGHGSKEVASKLDISLNTCRGYVKAIFAKLGTHSQLESVMEASRRGMLEQPSHG